MHKKLPQPVKKPSCRTGGSYKEARDSTGLKIELFSLLRIHLRFTGLRQLDMGEMEPESPSVSAPISSISVLHEGGLCTRSYYARPTPLALIPRTERGSRKADGTTLAKCF